MVYTQGETHILQTYFHGATFSGPFYIGLGKGPFPQSEDSSLDDVNEITGFGYTRMPVNRDQSPYGWSIDGDLAQGAEVSWFNTDLSTSWEPADYAFLTLSPSGVSAPAILICATDLVSTTIVAPQRKLKIIYQFRQL